MKTMIKIKPVKPASEAHNKREKELDYVRKDLSPSNEYWEMETQANRLAIIKEHYMATVHQKIQKTATPIREGVVIIEKETSLEELKNLANKLERRFHIKCFQIAIHKDEGHWSKKGQWVPNLHGHMVFDWTNENGKSIKLNDEDMCEMQTITAETLQMERGASSSKKHLNAIQYKEQKAMEHLQELEEELKQMKEQTGLGAKAMAFFKVGELASIREQLNETIKASQLLLEQNLEIINESKAREQKIAQEAKQKEISLKNQIAELQRLLRAETDKSYELQKKLWEKEKQEREREKQLHPVEQPQRRGMRM